MKKGNARKSENQNNLKRAIPMFLPAVLLLSLFFIGPALISVVYSFTDMTLSGVNSQEVHFVGFKNFVTLFNSPEIGTVVYNTIMFWFFSGVLGQQVLGLILALLLKRKAKGVRMFVGFTVSAGWITPEVVAIVMCSCFFASKGTLNTILGYIGVEPIQWLLKYPLISLIISNIWKGCAYSVMMFQAALDNVPDDLTEAACIDGASYFQTLFRVIIPIIKGSLVTDFMIITLGTLGTVGLIFGLTGGGPGNTSTTLSMLMYKKAFVSFQVGYGMAIALVILIAGVLLSVGYTKLVSREK